MAPTRQRLENDVFTVGGIAQKYNCALKRLDWQQEQGFVSSLALGYNEVEDVYKRQVYTGAIASQKKDYRFKIGTIGEKKPEDWIVEMCIRDRSCNPASPICSKRSVQVRTCW